MATEPMVVHVVWERGAQPFLDRKYSRAHEWRFDGGTVVPASSSPGVVRVPLSRVDAVDPEEALMASVSACHMLFFLDFAARAGFRIDRYDDAVEGEMGKAADGRIMVTRITIKPSITWSGETHPGEADIEALHHKSHDACFIANSLKSEVVIGPTHSTFA